MIDPADPTCVAVRDQLLLDLFTTAIPDSVQRWAHGYMRAPDRYWFEARIVDIDIRRHRITRATMLHGLLAAAYTWRERVEWSTEYPPTLLDADQRWTFNAADADLVVQLGVFHDLPYTTEALMRRGLIRKETVFQSSAV